MLETQLYFDFRDMFRAPRLALGRRMLVMLEALLVSYAFFVSLTYIALLIDGYSFGSIWNDLHLFPAPFVFLAQGFLAKSVEALAYVIAFISIWLGFTAVAKITIKEYKGDLFYSSKDGWKWALDNWFPVFFGPIGIAIVLAFFVIMAALLGWLAQWPVLDILFYGMLFIIFLPTALFLAVSALALAVGAYMSPSIVACAEEDTMGSMFGSYTLMWNQPVRLILYTAMVLVLAVIGYHAFYFFILSAFKLLEMVFGHDAVMGDTFVTIRQVGLDLFAKFNFLPSYLQFPVCLTGAVSGCGGGCHGCAGAAVIAPTLTQAISGVLVGIISLLSYLAIPAYALATLGTGFATSFIVLTKHKDDQDLIKRKDADERAAAEAEEAETAEEESATSDPTDAGNSEDAKSDE